MKGLLRKPLTVEKLGLVAVGLMLALAPCQSEAGSQGTLADLRILELRLSPQPLPDGGTARISLLLHNASTASANGDIAVRVIHDRATPLPVPGTSPLLHMAADELKKVTFEVTGLRMSRSPYLFSAMIDADGRVAESNEANNVLWERVAVCGGAAEIEVGDGFDNDCDGLIDEGLQVAGGSEWAIKELERRRRTRRLDQVPLVFALARPFFPYALAHPARLVAGQGQYVGARATGDRRLRAARKAAGRQQGLVLLDLDGGGLESGDLISLRADGGRSWVVADGGGGGEVHVRSGDAGRARVFVLLKVGGEGEIVSGDGVVLRSSTGHYLSAEGGGGSWVSADREAPGPGAAFTLQMEEKR
ncbi:MAG: CARDB domain-containing protein [Acidobacteriota bacterium]